jgi:hypothetical protein
MYVPNDNKKLLEIELELNAGEWEEWLDSVKHNDDEFLETEAEFYERLEAETEAERQKRAG